MYITCCLHVTYVHMYRYYKIGFWPNLENNTATCIYLYIRREIFMCAGGILLIWICLPSHYHRNVIKTTRLLWF